MIKEVFASGVVDDNMEALHKRLEQRKKEILPLVTVYFKGASRRGVENLINFLDERAVDFRIKESPASNGAAACHCAVELRNISADNFLRLLAYSKQRDINLKY